jgi:hypothetical protein
MPRLGLDPDTIRENIGAARARKAAALAEYKAATDELEWWTQGAAIFGLELSPGPDSVSAEMDELFVTQEALADNAKPTLRQAIATLLTENPTRPLTLSQLTAGLSLRGWLPTRADAQKAVSDMASTMTSENQLERVDRGTYRLHPRLALALETWEAGASAPLMPNGKLRLPDYDAAAID